MTSFWPASHLSRTCNQRGRCSCIALEVESVVRPELVHEFAEGHNTGLLNCLCSIMNIVPGQIHEVVKDIITMLPAYRASWADSLPMIRERHPEVPRTIIDRAGRPRVSYQNCAGFGRSSWVRSPKLGSGVNGRKTSPTRTR